jgi:hypothetical protein
MVIWMVFMWILMWCPGHIISHIGSVAPAADLWGSARASVPPLHQLKIRKAPADSKKYLGFSLVFEIAAKLVRYGKALSHPVRSVGSCWGTPWAFREYDQEALRHFEEHL